MSVKVELTATLAVAALCFAISAFAERVSIKDHSQTRVQGACGQSGGVYVPKKGRDGTYGCMNSDGGGIVCGGVSKNDKKTCDTFLTLPPSLPTRSEALKADKTHAK